MTIDEARDIAAKCAKKMILELPKEAGTEVIAQEIVEGRIVAQAFKEHPLIYYFTRSVLTIIANTPDDDVENQMGIFLAQCFYFGYQAGRQSCIDLEVERMLKANE